jgi:pre-60S factor REI1
MPLVGDTTTTTATTMEAQLGQSNHAIVTEAQAANQYKYDMDNPSSSPIDTEFDRSQCLFCTQTSKDLDDNLVHMSKAHGFHVDPTHLLVEIASLLAYFHLVIFSHHECIFCGTQRSSHLAVQQHMMAKGHCKYDVTDKDPDLQDLFDVSLDAREELRHNFAATRVSDSPQPLSQDRSRKSRSSRLSDKRDPSTFPPSSTSPLPTDTESDSDSLQIHSRSLLKLSARVLKQEYTLNNQLAQLRADDWRSLSHLPASQQRALLLTHHKQTEKARRAEQTYQGNLENAGNSFNCLGKIRLIRKPPHTGNIHSLKR